MSDAHRPARWGGGSGKKSVQATHAAGAATPAPPEPSAEGPDATDAAKALAAEHNVDLAFVVGSGEEGRITKGDVQAQVEPPTEPEPAEPIPDEAEAVVAPPLPAVPDEQA